MKLTRHAILTASLLFALITPDLAGSSATRPRVQTLRERFEQHELSAEMRRHVDVLCDDLGPLLERLPLEKLDAIEVRGSRIDLVFGLKGKTRVQIPDTKHLVLDERRKVLTTTTRDGATLRFASRLRFRIEDGELHLRRGDVQVKKLFWFDLDVRTRIGPARPILDVKGRPYVALDARGRPQKDASGRYRLRRAERWLALEAKGRTVQLALPLEL